MARTVKLTLPAGSVSDSDDDELGNTVDGEVITDAQRDADQAERDQRDDVIAALTQLDTAGDARWQVIRTLPADRAGYLFDLTTAELKLSTIKERAGPGTYRVTGYDNKGRYIRRQTFVIAPESTTAPSNTSMVPFSGPRMNEWQEWIDKQRMAQKEELKFWVGLLAPFLGPLLLKMFERKESGIGELVGALKGLKGMTDPEDATAQLAKTKQLIELVKELGGDKETTGSTWPDIVRDLAGGVTQALPQIATAFAAARSGQPAPSVMAGIPPESIAPPGAAPPTEGDPMMALLTWLNAQLPSLITKAQKNSDAGAYAYVMLDNLPPNADLGQIHGMLSRDDWFAMLSQINPHVRQYEAWFTELRGALMEEIETSIPSLKKPKGKKNRGGGTTINNPPDDQIPGQAP